MKSSTKEVSASQLCRRDFVFLVPAQLPQRPAHARSSAKLTCSWHRVDGEGLEQTAHLTDGGYKVLKLQKKGTDPLSRNHSLEESALEHCNSPLNILNEVPEKALF